MAQNKQPAESLQLRLALTDYRVEDGTVNATADGCTFECSLGPVSADVLAALDEAAAAHAQVCLDGKRPILLALHKVERKDPQRVRIAGRLLDPTMAASWAWHGSEWA